MSQNVRSFETPSLQTKPLGATQNQYEVGFVVLQCLLDIMLEVLRLKFRRSATYESILQEGLGLYLATVHELM